MNILFGAYLRPKNFHKKLGQKFLKVRIWMFLKVGSRSGQKFMFKFTGEGGNILKFKFQRFFIEDLLSISSH
jgi:hypothetical protein